MKRAAALMALLQWLLPLQSRGEALADGISEALDKLELEELG